MGGESRNEEETSKQRTPRPANRKNGEKDDKKPRKNTGDKNGRRKHDDEARREKR